MSTSVIETLVEVPAPIEKPIDIPSLLSKLSSLLPGDRQLERRARKLAWQLSKGRLVTCGWDLVFLSELTPTESRMPDDEFVALYADQVKTATKKGGRPRKYRTAKAQKKGTCRTPATIQRTKASGSLRCDENPLAAC